MSEIRIALSDPQSLAQFRRAAQSLLESRAQITVDVRDAAEAMGRAMGVHREDIQRTLDELLQLPQFQVATPAARASNPLNVKERPFRLGQLVRGTVTHIDENSGELRVDIGTDRVGLLSRDELGSNEIDVGDEIEVAVCFWSTEAGHPVLSKSFADHKRLWIQMNKDHAAQTQLTGLVQKRVKNGLMVRLSGFDIKTQRIVDRGTSAFVPTSQLAGQKDYDSLVGTGSILVQITGVDEENGKVIASEIAAVEDGREKSKRESALLSAIRTLRKGQVVEGIVRQIYTNNEVAVDLGGYDGRLYLSNLSWYPVEHPCEVIRKGEKIRVVILEVRGYPGPAYLELGLKQLKPAPGETGA